MTKHELSLQRRRERYLLKKDKINKLRREQYAVARESGLGYVEARKVRAYSVETATKKYANIKSKTIDNIKYIYVYTPKKDIYKDVKIPIIKKVSKRTERRRIARSLGYTPDEADYLRGVADDKWEEIISGKVIVDKLGRENRWAMMSSKEKYDKTIEDECEAINIEAGYDVNSRYGWAVYYFWYINGGDIEDWKDFCEPDKYLTDMLDYKGDASTYLLRKGIKTDNKSSKYEKVLKTNMKYVRKGHHHKVKLGTPRNAKNVYKDNDKIKKRPYKRHASKVS